MCAHSHTHTHTKLILCLSLSNLFKMLMHRQNLSFSHIPPLPRPLPFFSSFYPFIYCISTIARLSLKRVKVLIPLLSPALLIFSSRAELDQCVCVWVGYSLISLLFSCADGFPRTLIFVTAHNHNTDIYIYVQGSV